VADGEALGESEGIADAGSYDVAVALGSAEAAALTQPARSTGATREIARIRSHLKPAEPLTAA
jgi:hypothetical protein